MAELTWWVIPVKFSQTSASGQRLKTCATTCSSTLLKVVMSMRFLAEYGAKVTRYREKPRYCINRIHTIIDRRELLWHSDPRGFGVSDWSCFVGVRSKACKADESWPRRLQNICLIPESSGPVSTHRVILQSSCRFWGKPKMFLGSS